MKLRVIESGTPTPRCPTCDRLMIEDTHYARIEGEDVVTHLGVYYCIHCERRPWDRADVLPCAAPKG